MASCSKIEINDDPIIGIWKKEVKMATNSNNLVIDTEEWIFNDVYLGRFNGYKNNEVQFLTDFRWTLKNNVYTISYPGTDFPDDYVTIQEDENGIKLVKEQGKLFARHVD